MFLSGSVYILLWQSGYEHPSAGCHGDALGWMRLCPRIHARVRVDCYPAPLINSDMTRGMSALPSIFLHFHFPLGVLDSSTCRYHLSFSWPQAANSVCSHLIMFWVSVILMWHCCHPDASVQPYPLTLICICMCVRKGEKKSNLLVNIFTCLYCIYKAGTTFS